MEAGAILEVEVVLVMTGVEEELVEDTTTSKDPTGMNLLHLVDKEVIT